MVSDDSVDRAGVAGSLHASRRAALGWSGRCLGAERGRGKRAGKENERDGASHG